ncbi:MAG: type II toxin-antitoxin system PemK/MazF family toxin [Treponema sp.]|nr:type II toxin-antitoxin system PemK/MazF family toxin [Treponema sp.]
MKLSKVETKLPKDSVAVTPQITVIDNIRLLEYVSTLPEQIMQECAENIKLLLALD